MKTATVLNLKGLHIKELFCKNKVLYVFALLFLFGVVFGTVLFVKNQNVRLYAESLFDFYVSARKGRGFLKIASHSFISSVYLLLFSFFCGASLLGLVFIPISVCFSGAAAGAVISFVYSAYSFKGIAFNAIILIPPLLPILVCFLFSAKESFFFSICISKLTMPKSRPANLYDGFRLYCGKFIIFLLIVFLSSIINGFICDAFLDYFKF